MENLKLKPMQDNKTIALINQLQLRQFPLQSFLPVTVSCLNIRKLTWDDYKGQPDITMHLLTAYTY